MVQYGFTRDANDNQRICNPLKLSILLLWKLDKRPHLCFAVGERLWFCWRRKGQAVHAPPCKTSQKGCKRWDYTVDPCPFVSLSCTIALTTARTSTHQFCWRWWRGFSVLQLENEYGFIGDAKDKHYMHHLVKLARKQRRCHSPPLCLDLPFKQFCADDHVIMNIAVLLEMVKGLFSFAVRAHLWRDWRCPGQALHAPLVKATAVLFKHCKGCSCCVQLEIK